jgi:hypothetical protein
MTVDQGVTGSNPVPGANQINHLQQEAVTGRLVCGVYVANSDESSPWDAGWSVLRIPAKPATFRSKVVTLSERSDDEGSWLIEVAALATGRSAP